MELELPRAVGACFINEIFRYWIINHTKIIQVYCMLCYAAMLQLSF